MAPWIKPFRDWAMRDLWPLFRHGSGPQPDMLQYAWEKAGLTLDNQPIAWNAEAVTVQGVVHFPKNTPRCRSDFHLRLSGKNDDIPLEGWTETGERDSVRMSFRFPPPAATTMAELCWRERSLGRVTLPVFSQREFISKLQLHLPTVSVRLGEQTVACRTFVGAQCQGLVVSAVLRTPHCLVPLQDLSLRVMLQRADSGLSRATPLHLAATQLTEREALLTANLHRPRRLGAWEVSWHLEDEILGTQKLRAISKAHFHRSLRLASTRFVTQNEQGELKVERVLSEKRRTGRAGPCFLIGSIEPGMAGLCRFEVRAEMKGPAQAPLLQEQQILISDGPVPFVPGTLDLAELMQVKQFELRMGKHLLGVLPLAPVPTASFTSEGGFTAPEPFAWSATAEEQLREKLNSLLIR